MTRRAPWGRWVASALAAVGLGCAPRAAPPPEVAAAVAPAPAPATSPDHAVPAPEGRAAPAAPKTLAERARRVTDAYLAAFGARDAERLASLYAEDACVTGPLAAAAPVCGRAAIAEAARAAWATIPEVKAAWGRAWIGAELVAVESAWSAEARGGVSLVVARLSPDGAIAEARVYADPRASLAAPATKPRVFEGLPTTRETYVASAADGEAASRDRAASAFAAPALTNDAELVDEGRAGTLVGSKVAARWVASRAAGMAGARSEVTRAWTAASFAIVEYETKGTAPGRAETASSRGAEVLELAAEGVRRAWRYDDPTASATKPRPGAVAAASAASALAVP